MGSTVLFEQLSIVQCVWRMSSTIESIGRKKIYIQQAESLMCGGILHVGTEMTGEIF